MSDERLKECCQLAQAWADVESLGEGSCRGLDADVGYRGKYLSSGLAQRLCLARSFLRKKPLLLLDEAMGAQDKATAKEIAKELGDMQDTDGHPITVLAATHSNVFMDVISHGIMIVNGRIVECDTKERLLARKGHFYRRAVSETGLYIDDKGAVVITPERLRTIWLFSLGPTLSLQACSLLQARTLHPAPEP